MPEAKYLSNKSDSTESNSKPAGKLSTSDLGKISKIVGTAKSVTEELANVVDLKVKLVQTDLEEKVNEKVNIAIQKSMAIALIGIVAFFALVGVALVIGDLLGNSGYGFLLISAIILIISLVVSMWKPRLFSWQMNRVDIAGLIGPSTETENDIEAASDSAGSKLLDQ